MQQWPGLEEELHYLKERQSPGAGRVMTTKNGQGGRHHHTLLKLYKRMQSGQLSAKDFCYFTNGRKMTNTGLAILLKMAKYLRLSSDSSA